MVHRAGAHGARLLHLPAQGRLLLRGGPPRVLPPDPRQLLLRAVDRLPLPRAGRAAAGGRGAPRRLVRAHGAHLLPRAQDLRAVDVRRPAAAFQGGQPVQPPLHRRQLRRRAARRQDGPPRGAHLLLRRRARPLHCPLRHALPAAPHQRDAPQGAPPGLLPLRRRSQRRLHGLGQDQRRVRQWRQDRLLHRTLLVHVTGCADQLLQGIQVLAGVVGVHVPDDGSVDRDHHVRDGGDQRADDDAVDRALRHRDRHGGWAAGDHHVPRLRAEGPLPQRRLHRHQPEEAQVQQDPRALPLLQLRHEGARALRLQAAPILLRLLGVQLPRRRDRIRSVRDKMQSRALGETDHSLHLSHV